MTMFFQSGTLALRCDGCGYEPKDLTMPSPAAVTANAEARRNLADEARAKSWLIRRTAGSWQHYCPTCARHRAGDITRQDRLL
tara:strand:+ start:548 stop:796 length:249 start_codon:yes stop_codon:yes gene_type:complete